MSGLFGYPWLTLLIAIALALRYQAWELVAIGIFLDLLWLPDHVSLANMPLATLIALGLVVIFEPLRRQLLTSSRF